jgi:hypothetical protein
MASQMTIRLGIVIALTSAGALTTFLLSMVSDGPLLRTAAAVALMAGFGNAFTRAVLAQPVQPPLPAEDAYEVGLRRGSRNL